MANTVTAKSMAPLRKCVSFLTRSQNLSSGRELRLQLYEKYAVGYDGGCWEYITYENGACAFIAPDGYQLTLPNYFDEPVSAKEAGIIVALYAYSHFAAWRLSVAGSA